MKRTVQATINQTYNIENLDKEGVIIKTASEAVVDGHPFSDSEKKYYPNTLETRELLKSEVDDTDLVDSVLRFWGDYVVDLEEINNENGTDNI